MGTNYIIREAIDSDFQQILSIYRYCWDDYFKNTPADYEQVLKYLKEAFDNRQGYFNFWVCDNGEGEIFADQAARERRHHWSRGPWEDDPDERDHDGAGETGPGEGGGV